MPVRIYEPRDLRATMAAATDIICSRCGTPFVRENGKVPVNCIVCGQLRPDLDMTLDEPADPQPAAARVVPLDDMVVPKIGPAAVRPSEQMGSRRPFVAMSEPSAILGPDDEHQSVMDLIGPVVLVMVPFASFMAGALVMLYYAPDFSSGTWYAVVSVGLVTTAATILAGMVLSILCYVVRLRMKVVVRVAFLLAAGATGYFVVSRVPPQIQVRPDSLPALRLK